MRIKTSIMVIVVNIAFSLNLTQNCLQPCPIGKIQCLPIWGGFDDCVCCSTNDPYCCNGMNKSKFLNDEVENENLNIKCLFKIIESNPHIIEKLRQEEANSRHLVDIIKKYGSYLDLEGCGK